MIYLHKILPLIISPVIFVLIIVSLGIILRSRIIGFFGIFFLIFFSLPVISNTLLFYLEKEHKLIEISNVKNADAIVVLSGMVRVIKNDEELKYEFSESVDRILAGIELIKKNKAPYLILTRGKLPWSKGKPEGEVLYDFVIKSGIDKKKIILTDNAENTFQEAVALKKLINYDFQKILLVTSAFHMNRAEKIFTFNDIEVIPYPVDFRHSKARFTIMDIIPSAFALKDTSHVIREIIGRIYYKLKL